MSFSVFMCAQVNCRSTAVLYTTKLLQIIQMRSRYITNQSVHCSQREPYCIRPVCSSTSIHMDMLRHIVLTNNVHGSFQLELFSQAEKWRWGGRQEGGRYGPNKQQVDREADMKEHGA